MVPDNPELAREVIKPVAELPAPHTEASEQKATRFERIKRFAGKAAVVAAVTVGSGTAGVMFAPTPVHAGPHNADINIAFDGNATVDGGPLGQIEKPIDIKIPLLDISTGLGAKITVKDAPSLFNEDPNNLNFSNKNVRSYTNLFTDYESDINEWKTEILGSWLAFAALGNLALLGAVSLRKKFGDDEKIYRAINNLGGQNLARAFLAASITLASFAPIIVQKSQSSPDANVSQAFNGTALEGAHVSGIMQFLVNKLGADALKFIENTEDFYDTAAANLRTAYKNSAPLTANDSSFLAVTAFGWHCNIGGISRELSEVVSLYKPELYIDGGDMVFSGTELEDMCVKTVSDAVGDIDKVLSPGDHDSVTTIRQAEKYGFQVLDGKVQKIHGVPMLGDASARVTKFGEGIRPRHNQTEAEIGYDLMGKACSRLRSPLLVVNEPGAAEASVEYGCADLALAGGRRNTYDTTGLSPYFVSGSAGGAADSELTIGPISGTNPAAINVMEIDKESGRVLRIQSVLTYGDKSVFIEEPVLTPFGQYFGNASIQS